MSSRRDSLSASHVPAQTPTVSCLPRHALPPQPHKTSPPDRRIRVLRVIARLNMGGPAHHVGYLSGLLDPERYETLLLHGAVGSGEAELSATADLFNVRRETVPGLRPELGPQDDLRALRELTRWVRRFRP